MYMASTYEELVALDERTALAPVSFDQVEFSIGETENGERLITKFGDHEVEARKSDRQFENICKAFEVPTKFAANVSQNLLKDIFEEVKQQKVGQHYNWVIDTEDNELIAYGSSKKPYIPYGSVGEIFQAEGLTELQGELTRYGEAEIVGTSPEIALIEPRVGDITQSGANIHFNPMMDNPPQLYAWSYRLWCSNGMGDKIGERINVTGHSVDEVLEQIEFQARRAFQQAEHMNNRFADLVDHQVNPVEAMRNLGIANNIPRRVRRNLIDEASALPDHQRTMYDVLNIFTRFASGEYDPSRRLALQNIGGNVALNHHLHCNRCGHELD